MQPKDIADKLGFDRDQIRERIKYFKKQGVFTPEIPVAGKYSTEYTENDYQNLERLVVLTKVGLTCGDIKKVQEHKCSLSQALIDRKKALYEKIREITGSLELLDEVLDRGYQYDSIPSGNYLSEIRQRELNGEAFIDPMDFYDYHEDMLRRDITCPACGATYDVDMDEFTYDTCSNDSQREDDMGGDVVYYFDSDESYHCPKCRKILHITGWLREYPIGAYDSDDIDVTLEEED